MILIKRYSNRKLYNTTVKKYITLDELAHLIRNGADIQVIDNDSGEDLTSITLTQIILETEKKHQSGLPNSIFAEIIKSRADELKALHDFFSPSPNLFRVINEQITHLIPSKKDFEDLSSRIDELSEKIDNLLGDQHPK